MSIATHHDEEAENQWGEVNSPIKQKDILVGIALPMTAGSGNPVHPLKSQAGLS